MTLPHQLPLRLLLGDFTYRGIAHVDHWLASVEHQQEVLLELRTDKVEWFLAEFEFGCALLYDARLTRAVNAFQSVHASFSGSPSALPNSILALLGLGRALNGLRRYARADRAFQHALAYAREQAQPDLTDAAYWFWVSNRCDLGATADLESQPPLPDVDDRLQSLLAAHRALAFSRVHLRSGHRGRALQEVDSLIDSSGHTLPPLVVAFLLQQRGTIAATNGRASAARSDLEEAVSVFQTIGYRRGEAQALLTLAQVNAQVDNAQATANLRRVSEILTLESDPIDVSSSNGRQMPIERIRLLSCQAQVAWLRGDNEGASRYVREELEALRGTAGAQSTAPTAFARALHDYGVIAASQGRVIDGCQRLAESTRLFERAGDMCLAVMACADWLDAHLQGGRMHDASSDTAELASGLSALERLLGVLPAECEKERAIADAVRAAWAWHTTGDAESAIVDLRRAASILQEFGIDYYYARSILYEAEILLQCADAIGAISVLRHARRCSQALDIAGLSQRIDRLVTAAQCSDLTSDIVGRCNCCVLAIDVCGLAEFASSSGNVVDLISAVCTLLARTIFRFGGHTIRFLGDSCIAIFGLDARIPTFQYGAIACATELRRLFRGLVARWGSIPGPFSLRFGLAVGEVVLARFGSGTLSETSVLGSAVRTATHLLLVADDNEMLMPIAAATAIGDCYKPIVREAYIRHLKGIGDIECVRLSFTDVEILQRRTPHAIGLLSSSSTA